MMRAMKLVILSTTALVGTLACSFHARSPEQYRDDTRALLETRGPQIESCYRDALEATNETTGSVIVNFKVQHKSGLLTEVRIDEKSTAAEPLRECVVKALDGLTLSPPDARDGVAVFRYEFSPAS
jgi:hypothetical protein